MPSIRNAVITGPVLQVMFFVTASRVDLPLEVFYTLLLLVLLGQLVFLLVLEPGNEGLRKIRKKSDDYAYGSTPKQVLAGAALALAIGTPVLLFGRPAAVADLPSAFVTQALFVGFVETIYLVVTVETIPYGEVLWPFIFAFSHESVRGPWFRGDFSAESFLSFGYVALFGLLFYQLYHARDRDLGGYEEWFGAVTSWTTHVGLNLIVLVRVLELWGFAFVPV